MARGILGSHQTATVPRCYMSKFCIYSYVCQYCTESFDTPAIGVTKGSNNAPELTLQVGYVV